MVALRLLLWLESLTSGYRGQREYLLISSLSPKAVHKDGENKRRRSNNHTILDVESTFKRGD